MKLPVLATDVSCGGTSLSLAQLQLVRASLLLTQWTLRPWQLKVPLQPLVTYIPSRPMMQP